MSMIPKIINYCWFGKQPMPELAIKCLNSWDMYLPDYKKVLWNEDSFDVDSVQFTKEAYQCKKYAFVSDYVRLYA
ncbi:MAG: glycosyl transferase, partial [Clostridiales bacterium]|nr:glycosyl transferase [Clostridiales bacterium]